MWESHLPPACARCPRGGACPDVDIIADELNALQNDLDTSACGSRMGHISVHCRHQEIIAARAINTGKNKAGAMTQEGQCGWTFQMSNQCQVCPKLAECQDRIKIHARFRAVQKRIASTASTAEGGILIMDCRELRFEK